MIELVRASFPLDITDQAMGIATKAGYPQAI
jgi:hypothetical protein